MILLVSLFYGCGPSAEDVLKKYEPYALLTTESDKLPVSFGIIANAPMINYPLSLISSCQEYVNTLAGRRFVADALNPDVRLPAKVKVMTVADMAAGHTTQSASYGNSLALNSIETPFLLVGFEGIAPAESKEAAIPPAFSSKQTYSGKIPFENSKNVTLKMTLSPDLKQVTELTISGEEIKLTPDYFEKQRKPSDKAFKFLENSGMKTNFAIITVNGYRTVERDEAGRDKIESVELKGGFKTTDTIDIADGKIILDEMPFICNLTVTKACIYGQVKLELNRNGTQSVYVVLKNITTPQNIPEEILKKP